MRLDVERLEALCGRWLNHPLDRQLRFELRPFSAELESAWGQAVELVLSYERMGIALPQAAAMSFDEFMLSLVLAQHPHNYSDELRGLSGTAAPRIVREAEHWMRTGGPEVSVSKIAALLGVSLRSLEAGFREWRRMTPTQYLRKIRKRSKNDALDQDCDFELNGSSASKSATVFASGSVVNSSLRYANGSRPLALAVSTRL